MFALLPLALDQVPCYDKGAERVCLVADWFCACRDGRCRVRHGLFVCRQITRSDGHQTGTTAKASASMVGDIIYFINEVGACVSHIFHENTSNLSIGVLPCYTYIIAYLYQYAY